MNKNQLKEQNKNLLLYDLSSYIEKKNYQTYKRSLEKKGLPCNHLRTIAPFGVGIVADMYYFSESKKITGSDLLQIGFEAVHSQFYTLAVNGFVIEYKVVNGSGIVYIDSKPTNITTMNLLTDLISSL